LVIPGKQKCKPGFYSEVIRRAENVMTNLGKSSETIGSIIEVIDDIADQTNLLALNAAIEAARAGEHGKGFAVVADEVRKLAERTAVATKEISSLIKGIQGETSEAIKAIEVGAEKVDNGLRLSNEAGASIEKIVSGIENVTSEIKQVTTATQEQAKGSAKIIDAIKEVTNQATMVTMATKEQVANTENVIREVVSAREQVRQVAVAVKEQAKQGQNIVISIENVTEQAAQVANAAKEQAIGVAEIIKGVDNAREQVSKSLQQ